MFDAGCEFYHWGPTAEVTSSEARVTRHRRHHMRAMHRYARRHHLRHHRRSIIGATVRSSYQTMNSFCAMLV